MLVDGSCVLTLIIQIITVGYISKGALIDVNTFTFMHLAETYIQSDLQCIQTIYLLSVCVFPGN